MSDDIRLTDADRADLWTAYTHWEEGDDFGEHMGAAVERILAARTAALQAEVEAWKHSRYYMSVRAEAAEAEVAEWKGVSRRLSDDYHELRAKVERVEAVLAKPDLSSWEIRTQIRAALGGGSDGA